MKAAVTALEAVDGTKFKHGPISDIIYVAYGSSVDWAYDQVSCHWWGAAVLISHWSRASNTRSGWSCATSDTTASCCPRSVLSMQCRYSADTVQIQCSPYSADISDGAGYDKG